MIDLLIITIILISACLCYKGVEIFQLAFLSNSKNRNTGMIIGVCFTVLSVVISGVGVLSAISCALQIASNLDKLSMR